MDHLIEVESDMQDWDISAFVQVVFRCIEKRRWNLGLGILKFALDEYPLHYEFYHLQGVIYSETGDNSKALECFLSEENAINIAEIQKTSDEVEICDITDNLLCIATCYLHSFQAEKAYLYLSTIIDKYGDLKIYTVVQAYYLRARIKSTPTMYDTAQDDISKACAILCFIKILPGFTDDLELEKNLQAYLQNQNS
jgi:tetratricopeptide (TPR) repeat protein